MQVNQEQVVDISRKLGQQEVITRRLEEGIMG